MDMPTMFEPYLADADIHVLPSYFPLPGMGIVPINTFVLKSQEPLLVDTGQAPVSARFIEMLSSVIAPGELRWLYLTHADPDHIGNLERILEIAPRLRVITTYLALGKLSLFRPMPLDRFYLLNVGQSIRIGDRTLTAIKPPTFDAPETTGFFDSATGVLFSADSFGALMTDPVEDAAAIGRDRLKEGLLTWATIDSPWLQTTDRSSFKAALGSIRALAPKVILSSHLPAARAMSEDLLGFMAEAPSRQPFVGPDQQAFEAMLRGPAAA